MAVLDPGWLMRALRRPGTRAVPGWFGQLAVRLTLINNAAPFWPENSWNIRRLTLTD